MSNYIELDEFYEARCCCDCDYDGPLLYHCSTCDMDFCEDCTNSYMYIGSLFHYCPNCNALLSEIDDFEDL